MRRAKHFITEHYIVFKHYNFSMQHARVSWNIFFLSLFLHIINRVVALFLFFLVACWNKSIYSFHMSSLKFSWKIIKSSMMSSLLTTTLFVNHLQGCKISYPSQFSPLLLSSILRLFSVFLLLAFRETALNPTLLLVFFCCHY